MVASFMQSDAVWKRLFMQLESLISANSLEFGFNSLCLSASVAEWQYMKGFDSLNLHGKSISQSLWHSLFLWEYFYVLTNAFQPCDYISFDFNSWETIYSLISRFLYILAVGPLLEADFLRGSTGSICNNNSVLVYGDNCDFLIIINHVIGLCLKDISAHGIITLWETMRIL